MQPPARPYYTYIIMEEGRAWFEGTVSKFLPQTKKPAAENSAFLLIS